MQREFVKRKLFFNTFNVLHNRTISMIDHILIINRQKDRVEPFSEGFITF